MPISLWPKSNHPYKQFFLIHLVITVTLTLAAQRLCSENNFQSFCLGQFYVWLTFISISFSVRLFFLKKNIALLIAIIVFKWPILIYVVYLAARLVNPSSLFLAAGFVPILISSLVWALMQKE